MGSHSTSRGRVRAVHLGELDRRAGWLLHKNSDHPFARIHSRGSSNYRRHYWLASGKQAFRCPRYLALPSNSPGHRGNQIDLYKVGAIDLNRPGGSGEPPLPYRKSSFGAVSGDQGLTV